MTCRYPADMRPQPAPRAAERRRMARQKSLLRGTIHFNNRRSALDCLIRDISRYGARLTFSDAVTVPDVLELHIPQKNQTLRTHVIWRRGQEVGVAFTNDTVDGFGETGDLAERVQHLEAEVAALKRLLRQFKAAGAPQEFEPD
jgi:hypothetical protein